MSVRYCHVCQTETLSGASVDRSGPIEICSTCATPYPPSTGAIVLGERTSAGSVEPEHEPVPIGRAVEAPGIAVQYSLPGLPAPVASKAIAKAVDKALATAPRDALRDIRERRRAIKPEIKRLRALEAEDRELAAAESAIEAARRADVTPIRRTK